MSDLSLVPPTTLTQKSATTVRPNRFILFTDSWLDLQTYIQTCLALPVSVQDFEKTYGAFDERKLVTDAFAAMQNLQGLTSDFGNPALLKKKMTANAAFLFGKEPPQEIYAHIVWLAMQMQNVASTFSYTLDNLDRAIGSHAGTKERRAQNLKDLLVGAGGLVAQAQDMRNKTQALMDKLGRFDERIQGANERVVFYTSQESAILGAANRLVGQYTQEIDTVLKPASEHALKAWRDFSIAAASVSVGLVLIGCVTFALAPATFGLAGIAGMGLVGGGVAAAIALGVLAERQHTAYNSYLDQISTKEAEKRKKIALVSDLSGLNSQISRVGRGLADFKTHLEVIDGIWLDIGGKLSFICGNYSVDQLSDLPWVTQAFKIGDAANKWGEIATTTEEFTQNSLVDYHSAKFGDRVPEPPKVAAAA